MAGAIIDGKASAARLRERVGAEAKAFEAAHGVRPGLKVIIVGDNPASRAYVRTKARMAEEAGLAGELIELPDTTTTEELLGHVERLNADPLTHGILVQLPLPKRIDEALVLDAVHPDKDVDGFHPLNVGRLFSAQKGLPEDLLVPCTPYGCLYMLKETLGADGLKGANAVIVGRSNIVGKPMAALLLSADCTVTVAHSRTKDLPSVCRGADILVAAVGRPRMVQGDWVKEGAVVIDVGINRVEGADGKGRIVGDVDFGPAAERAGAITPVPGGVGPMTVACLLRNTLVAARNLAGG
ncbi:MAG: bifunctional methylenetetrahydrofolate dehydrogenase/methenyltetrahydrofolate cyclohydrolase FolD [Geminicoccaceae bacterium]|nr:bifunctional methylenetetrahydrofolate dehydrogenase/methenyltetrahydrofolate cyclohydrolase FolD [Geminicoccaceae bacterium]